MHCIDLFGSILALFSQDDFFDHYEKGLRRLVGNFRSQADQQKTQADTLRQQLTDTQQLLYDVLLRLDKVSRELFPFLPLGKTRAQWAK